eukprot:g3640.t1
MKRFKKTITLLTIPLATVSLNEARAAATVLYTNDFSTGSTSSSVRLYENSTDGTWYTDGTTNSGEPSLWQISGGTLNNPATYDASARDKPNEGLAAMGISVTTTDTSLTSVTLSFNYSIGTGTTLYFHAVGLQNLATKANTNPQIFNTQAINGSTQDGQREDNYTDISLFDGSDPSGAATDAQALTGTGVFTGTYDISAFSSSGSTGITSVADLDFIAVAFGANVTDYTGDGAYSIDNFTITAVPEPSATALLGLAGLAFAARRRR